MKLRKLTLLLLIPLLVSTASTAQDFPYDKYQTRTLSELAESNSRPSPQNTGVKSVDFLISAKPFYSAVRVKYIGTSRSISKQKKDFLKIWQESLGYDAKVLDLYEDEYLFKECGTEYWLPVQKQVAAYFPKELEVNDNITLYLMVVGGLQVSKNWEPILLINEFAKY